MATSQISGTACTPRRPSRCAGPPMHLPTTDITRYRLSRRSPHRRRPDPPVGGALLTRDGAALIDFLFGVALDEQRHEIAQAAAVEPGMDVPNHGRHRCHRNVGISARQTSNELVDDCLFAQ